MLPGIKKGEKVRVTNPKATPRHIVVDVRGRFTLIAKCGDRTNVQRFKLDRIKRVKATAINWQG